MSVIDQIYIATTVYYSLDYIKFVAKSTVKKSSTHVASFVCGLILVAIGWPLILLSQLARATGLLPQEIYKMIERRATNNPWCQHKR